MKKILIFTLSMIFIASFVSAETVRVVYKLDKSVIVLHPSNKDKKPNETIEECIQRRLERMYESHQGLLYDDIDSSQLPKSRDDRMAWEGEKGKGVHINQDKAQQLQLEKAQRKLIEKEKTALVEKQAIDNLKASGELPPDYKANE